MRSQGDEELAARLGRDSEGVAELIERTCASLPQRRYYVFRISSELRRPVGSSDAPRTIAAFPTPDDALSFAQRNGYAMSAQIRAVAAVELIKLLLRDPQVGKVLFLQPQSGEASGHGFPPGITVTRQALLEQLAASPHGAVELTANVFDALQFGVDFSQRGAFRAALAEAVEAVVNAYAPPPGSLDRGPRSIYATGAVEVWLREHGFPHARQRRWIDVAGNPLWAGAEELCEIDCGTEQRLVVQLLIQSDDERQYIGRVIVTS